jgi:hypothetical protein
MRTIHAAAVLAACTALLQGCASVTSGTTQAVTVTPVCEGRILKAAACSLVNDKGRWELTAPGAVVLQKAYGDLAVVCRAGPATGTASFVSKPNTGVWGNVIAGGLIGYAIDSGTGAGFNYPTEMAVVLQPPCPAE